MFNIFRNVVNTRNTPEDDVTLKEIVFFIIIIIIIPVKSGCAMESGSVQLHEDCKRYMASRVAVKWTWTRQFISNVDFLY